MLSVVLAAFLFLTRLSGLDFAPSRSAVSFNLDPKQPASCLAISKKTELIETKQEEMEQKMSALSDCLATIQTTLDLLKDQQSEKAHKSCDQVNYKLLPSVNLCIRLSASTDTRDWYRSQKTCHAETGRLVNLDSREKQNAVMKYLDSIGEKAFDSSARFYRIWIGMKKVSSLDFEWTGHGSTDDMGSWGVGEPDQDQNQDVVQLKADGLSDISNYNKRRYMCEIVLT